MPTHSQDVSREIEILSLTGEEEGEIIVRATNELKKNKRCKSRNEPERAAAAAVVFCEREKE